MRALLAVAVTWAAATAAVPTSPSAASESRCVPSTVADGGVAAVTDDRYRNPATGVIRAVMIFVDFADAPAGDEDTGDYADVLLPDGTDWIETASYGRAQMEVTTVDRWFRMARDQDEYDWDRTSGFWASWWYVHDAVEAADPHVDFSPYDIVYIVPVSSAEAIDYSPAFIGSHDHPIEADGRSIERAVTFGQDIYIFRSKALAHETGHLFGLPDLYIERASFDGSPFVGGFDLMGTVLGNAPDHFAWNKLLLGWIDQSEVVCLDADGTAEVRLRPLSSSSGTRMVGLPIGDTRLYALEYRDSTGLDEPWGWRAEDGPCSTGVVAYLVDQEVATHEGPIRVVDPFRDGSAYGCHSLDEAAITPAAGAIGLGDDHVVEVVSLDPEEAVVRIHRSRGAGLAVAPPPQDLEGREMRSDPWAETSDTTVRVGTDDPIETALTISRLRFDDQRVYYVLLSRDDAYPDALASTGFMSAGTLLFNPSDRLRDDVAAEIERVLHDQLGRIYLLGGTSALSQEIEDTLVDAGHPVTRLWGESRIETALQIGKEVDRVFGSRPLTALIARARGTTTNPTAGWADSVTGGGYAAAARQPVVLSESTALPGGTHAMLVDYMNRAVLLGGTAALDDNVAARARAAVEPLHRVAGAARDATAAAVMTNLWHRDGGHGRFVVVNGYDEVGWLFGLAAAGLSADGLAPILLVDRDEIPPATREALSSCGEKQVETIVVGGPSLVSDATLEAIEALDGQAC